MLSSVLPRTSRILLLIGSLLLAATGCKRSSSQTQYPQYPQPYPQQPYPGAPGTVPPQAGAQPTGQPGVALPTPSGPDPINNIDLVFLRNQGTQILRELVAALPPLQQGRVANIPLVIDSTIGEVNAFATCTREGRAAMALTDGLLEIQSQLARSRAHDELAGTRKVDEYIQLIARGQRPNQPIVRPAAGFFDARVDIDPRKLARQRDILDEQIAFVLGTNSRTISESPARTARAHLPPPKSRACSPIRCPFSTTQRARG